MVGWDSKLWTLQATMLLSKTLDCNLDGKGLSFLIVT